MQETHPDLSKIRQIFERFQSNAQTYSDIYLARLFTHLTTNTAQESLREEQFITAWLQKAISGWQRSQQRPAPNLTSFLINIVGQLTKSERTFKQLAANNFYTLFFQFLDVKNPDCGHSTRFGVIKLLTACLDHESGVTCLSKSALTSLVIKWAHRGQTIYVTQEIYKFLYKFVVKMADKKQMELRLALAEIIAPLELQPNGPEIIEASIYDGVRDSLALVFHLFHAVLKSDDVEALTSKLGPFLLDESQLMEKIDALLLLAQNADFIYDLQRIRLAAGFITIWRATENVRQCITENTHNILRMYEYNSHKHHGNILKLAYLSLGYWNGLKKRHLGVELPDMAFFLFQLCPFFELSIVLTPACASKLKCPKDPESGRKIFEGDDFRNDFIAKLYDMVDTESLHLLHSWKEKLLDCPDLFSLAATALNVVARSKKYYERPKAAVLVQTLVYLLKDMIDFLKVYPDRGDYVRTNETFICQIFDTLSVFITEFEITWRDSVETICLMSMGYDFLDIPAWSARIVCAALALIKTSILKYTAPNMALLVDVTHNTTMAVLTPLLLTKCHDMAWEVRDSSLEIVLCIAELAHTKFPSLQKVIMEAELPSLVVTMSINDGESFVRATAIKCLQEMIQVDDIWTESLKDENLTKKMQKVLCTETEAIVRVEAATFMCKAYENGKILTEELDSLYSSMSHASTMDLHWEVKVRALDFWDRVIKSHLENQGMIDGCFPSVTFSKENRKIVTLTDNEIRKRLCKVLTQLSRIGCLGVLMAAIRDDCDVEVSKKAVSIAKPLLVLLKRHNVEMAEPTYDRSVSLSSGVSVEEGPGGGGGDFNQDDIIDQIVNAKDVSLLQGVYAGSDYGGSLCSEEAVRETRRVVQPNEFLELNENELEKAVQDKNKWLNGIEDLDSLLDDMLKSYEAGEVNVMDCY